MNAPSPAKSAEEQLVDEVGEFYADPLGFVLFAYPWGEPGPLIDYDGPDEWQREFLKDVARDVKARGFDGVHPVKPLRFSTASGHGIGKSALVAWLVDWIMSTRKDAQGTITANTSTQLETKTWAQIKKWTALCITAPWFTITSEKMYHRDHAATWFCSRQTCREENSEAFAGQHAPTSTSFYFFDEDSNIPDSIHEVAEGGLTDGEPQIYLFGNPTRSSGKFYRTVFGEERDRWNHRSIDSRDCKLPNHEQHDEWILDYGEDSDFVRVRVRGLPPNASDAQFIDAQRVWDAQKREAVCLKDDPLIVGVDMAWGGDDSNVIRFRKGFDARSIPAIRIPGEFTRDPAIMTVKLADVLSKTYKGDKVTMMFVDSAGIAGPVCQRLRILGHKNVVEVNFGAFAPDHKYANMRAYMWGMMKEWLLLGAIDTPKTGDKTAIRLETDITAPGYTHNKQIQVVLEDKKKMKARGVDSPDQADALALTFAMQVRPPLPKKHSTAVVTPWS